MSDIATLRAELKADLHLLADDATINRKIVSAMQFHRDRRLWFSERTFQFTLTAGKANYKPGEGPPLDLVEIVGKDIQLLIGGSESQREVVYRAAPQELDDRRYEGTQSGTPELFDMYGGSMRLWPPPDSSTDQLYGRYVSDISVPKSRYENGAFTFYAPPDFTRRMTTTDFDGFANDWTDQKGAYSMVRCRAAYLIQKEVCKDMEAANDWLAQWLEQVQQLENETERRTVGNTEIIGCILDIDEGAW